MRLFLALDLEDAICGRIAHFVEAVRNFAPDARWMKPESLHVTLKFIGEQPDTAPEQIKHAVAVIQAKAPEIQFRGYGFFPTPKSGRVFWVGMDAGAELAALASAVDEQTATLGIPKEDRPFNPHLTLARGSGASGSPRHRKEDKSNRVFELLQQRLAALPVPEFGTMTPREFFLYRSHLSPKGSTYTKLAKFPLQ